MLVLIPGEVVLAADEAASHGEVALGIGSVQLDNRNSRHGEYTGIADDETYWIGNVDGALGRKSAFLELHAGELGLDSRSMAVEWGKYGRYSFELSHTEIPHLVATDAKTPFDGAGGTRLALPDDFVPAPTSADMVNLDANLKTLDLRTDRETNAFRITRAFKNGWQAKLAYGRDDKNGVQSLGGTTAQNAGLVDAVILPQPVDYRTEEFTAGLAYMGSARQLEIGYFHSIFHNGNSSLGWDVPFLKDNSVPPLYPTKARASLPPDNTYQRFSLSGGVSLPGSTRVSATAELGRMSQDEALLPYSTDDIGGTASLTQDGAPLPRTSADMEVDVTHVTLNLAAQPAPRLGIDARYQFYETDNDSPYTLFDRVLNDTVPQSSTADIYSRPYGLSSRDVDIGMNFRFENGVNLRAVYGHETIDHKRYRAVRKKDEDTVKITLNSPFTDYLSGRIGYTHARRDARDYDAFISYGTLISPLSCPSLATVDPDPDTGGAVTIDTCFGNHPDVRQFDLASRRRNRLDASVVYSPDEALDIGLDVSSIRDAYTDDIAFDDTYLGLTSDDRLSMTVDAVYAPGAAWSINVYYTSERMSSRQNGRSFGASAASSIDSSLNWRAKFEDDIDTVGVNGDFNLLHDVLTVTVGYAYTKESNRIRFATGSGLSAEAMPEDGSERHAADIAADYRLRDNMRLRLGVGYEIFRSNDWSLDSVVAGGAALDDVLLLAGPVPDYRAWLMSAALIYGW